MIPDDPQIPDDDAVARAARRALGHLAGSDPADLSWEAVQSGARRVRQRRAAVAAAIAAVVLVGAGTAALTTKHAGDHVTIAGPHTSESTTSEAATSTSQPATTTSVPPPPRPIVTPIGGTQTTTPPPAPVAQPGDLAGTLTLASTTLVAEQPTTFTLSLTNITNHPIYFPSYPLLGVWIDSANPGGFSGVSAGQWNFVLAAGGQRTFTASVSPAAAMVGTAHVDAAIITASGSAHLFDATPEFIAGVPSVPVTIVPPDWYLGDTLDPSQGTWTATMSADAGAVQVGDAVAVHATVTNAGTLPQSTEGYGSLAIVCASAGSPRSGQFVDNVILGAGAGQTFTIQFTPTEQFVGTVTCSLGLAFHGDADQAGPRNGITSDTVTFTVTPVPTPTTTTTSAPDTSTTTTP